jgi:hypothetical protein
MSNPKDKKPSKKELIEDLKTAKEPLEVEGAELTDEDLDEVAGGCLCRCGIALDCGGGGGGQTLQ